MIKINIARCRRCNAGEEIIKRINLAITLKLQTTPDRNKHLSHGYTMLPSRKRENKYYFPFLNEKR